MSTAPQSPAPVVAQRYLTTREAAQYLGRSAFTLWKWRSRQTGPECFKRGGIVYYPVEGLDKWVRGE